MKLILASGSPRRAEILRNAGIALETRAADVDESRRAHETASEYVRRLALEKARAAASGLALDTKDAATIVIGADTVVVCERAAPHMRRGRRRRVDPSASLETGERPLQDRLTGAPIAEDEILGKPASVEEAREILRRLSGRAHEVHTGLALVRLPDRVERVMEEITRVEFVKLSEAEIEEYVASGEPADKAGAYAIQGLGGRYVRRIEGCYFNVMGLPLARLYEMLGELGWASR
jgi:septum formation protein